MLLLVAGSRCRVEPAGGKAWGILGKVVVGNVVAVGSVGGGNVWFGGWAWGLPWVGEGVWE